MFFKRSAHAVSGYEYVSSHESSGSDTRIPSRTLRNKSAAISQSDGFGAFNFWSCDSSLWEGRE